MSIHGMVWGKAAQFPSQHQVSVFVSEHLGVWNLLRILEPVNPGIARHARGKGVLYSPAQRLNPPNSRIQHMYALIAQLAVSVVPEESPVVVETIDVEWLFRRRPEPNVIVHGCRWITVGRVPDGRAQLALPGIDFANFPQLPGFQIFNGALKVRRTPILCADLANPLVSTYRITHHLSVLNGLRQRFFDINILPCLARQDSNPRVPVVGRGNEDSVDVFVVQHPLELLGSPRRLALGLFQFRVDLVENRLVDVAKGLELGPMRDSAQGVIPSLIAAANKTHHDLVVGPRGARVPIQKGARGQRRSCSYLLHKRSAGFLSHKFPPCVSDAMGTAILFIWGARELDPSFFRPDPLTPRPLSP